MKSLKDRIKDNQDFYNGITVGILLGGFGVLTLITKGNLPIVVEVGGK